MRRVGGAATEMEILLARALLPVMVFGVQIKIDSGLEGNLFWFHVTM